MFDDFESKSGFSSACEFINTQMTQFFKGRELPLTKKVFDQLANWVERQKTKLQGQQEAGDDADEEVAKRTINLKLNPYAIRSCLEAIWFTFGTVTSP